MVLATGLHLMHREFSHVVVTVILFALAAFVVYGRGFRAPAAFLRRFAGCTPIGDVDW
jgi:hypothetical protein